MDCRDLGYEEKLWISEDLVVNRGRGEIEIFDRIKVFKRGRYENSRLLIPLAVDKL